MNIFFQSETIFDEFNENLKLIIETCNQGIPQVYNNYLQCKS